MTVGESIKKGAAGTKNVTDKSVNAVESKINEVTDIVEDALKTAANKIHGAASQDKPSEK